MKEFDVIIVGAGPAGMSAAIYTSRRQLSTLVISKDIGGQAAATDVIENYPGYESVGGFDLMQKFMQQAQKTGTQFISGEVLDITKDNGSFLIKTAVEEYRAQALILSFGLTPRDLNVPGEEQFKYKGITHCATCDGPLFKGKDVMIVGGGNSALEAGEYMSKIANQVYMIVRKPEFKGEAVLLNKVQQAANIEIIYRSKIKEVRGDQVVQSVVITSAEEENTDADREIKVQGVIVEIGFVAKTDWIGSLVKLNERKEIITDKDNQTSEAGVFSCGDVSDISYKQAVISAGEGAKSALQAAKYLASKAGKDINIATDWGKQ